MQCYKSTALLKSDQQVQVAELQAEGLQACYLSNLDPVTTRLSSTRFLCRQLCKTRSSRTEVTGRPVASTMFKRRSDSRVPQSAQQ